MYIKNKYISSFFKAAICLFALFGILIQTGFFSGNINLYVLRYYTLLSNLLCCIYFGISSVYTFMGKGNPFPNLKGALTMCITVTGLVYHFMLSGAAFSMGNAFAFSNISLHYVVPIMSVLDWLIFDKKGLYTWKSPLLWTVIPNIYFVLITLNGFIIGTPFLGKSRFPYFFIDYDVLGVGKVLMYVIIISVLFIALGYILYGIDHFILRAKK